MTSSHKKTTSVALIVAAGSGERVGGEIPKQYQKLDGVPILRRSVLAFLEHGLIDEVRVVIDPGHRAFYDEAVQGLGLPEPIAGGASRQESVRLGLEALDASVVSHVLIHDAARPMVSGALIDRVIFALENADAVLPVVPLADTLKRVEADKVTATVARQGLYLAQTPQGFSYNPIIGAHQKFRDHAATDDAAIAELAGITVQTLEGEPNNFKITTRQDMHYAALMLASPRESRTAQGFDVHRFIPSSKTDEAIMLCGVAVPHTHALEGHSDADVGLHALVDAMLGCIGAGDIGQHFPPSDARWKGADSSVFVKHAADMLEARGASITNVDMTILCEMPKVAPHREAMRSRIATLLSITISRVSVKATTTEGLGFTGRKEGIAAQACVTLTLPVESHD